MFSIYKILKKLQFSLVVASLISGGALAPAVSAHTGERGQHEWIAPDGYVDPIGEAADIAPALSALEQKMLSKFSEPTDKEISDMDLVGRYGHLDPNHEIPTALLERAVAYYEKNRSRITNQSYLTVVAFGLYSGRARMFIVSMKSGKVVKLHVAHGSGSDPRNSGVATRFSNAFNSKASSLGYYRTAETYSGKHGLSLRLDGVSAGNSNARGRAIVIHGANYVYDSNTKAGRSSGCLAVSMNAHSRVVNLLKGGSIIYAGVSAD